MKEHCCTDAKDSVEDGSNMRRKKSRNVEVRGWKPIEVWMKEEEEEDEEEDVVEV